MRELPVMRELIRRGHKVTVVTGLQQAEVTDEYLDHKAEIIIENTDAGLVVIPGSLIIDIDATVAKIREHINKWESLIEKSVDADAYVIDICPWAVMAAKRKGIRSFLMTNFTWVGWITVRPTKPFALSRITSRSRPSISGFTMDSCLDR